MIDYEFLDSYTAVLTITVTDSFGPTSETINIEFGDINEAPYFSQTKYTLEPPESGMVCVLLTMLSIYLCGMFRF